MYVDDIIDLSFHPRLRWRRGALLGATMATLGLHDLARGRYLSFHGVLGYQCIKDIHLKDQLMVNKITSRYQYTIN